MLFDILTQNFNLKELARHPIKTVSKFFWNSPQLTVWTLKFLLARLDHWGNNTHTFCALRNQLVKTVNTNIVFMRKVEVTERMPDYGEYVIIFYSNTEHFNITEVAQLANTRQFKTRSGVAINVVDVTHWME